MDTLPRLKTEVRSVQETFLTFLFLLLLSTNFISGAITSLPEPDWSIAKADMVHYFYSYEPYESDGGGGTPQFRSLFPFFRQSQPPQQQQPNQPQPPHPPPLFNNNNNNNNGKSNRNYLPAPALQPQPLLSPSPEMPSSYQTLPGGSSNNYPPPAPPSPQALQQADPPTFVKLQDNLSAPKYTKFSLTDKKAYPNPRYPSVSPISITQLPDIVTSKPLGPVYEHPPTTTAQAPTITTTPKPRNEAYQHSASTSVDSQTIIWPTNVDENLTSQEDGTQVRFLVHKPGDEDVIRSALLQDGQTRNEEVKFIEGPMLRIQRHQKVYLPPKKKTVVYILLKEPQILTDVEVVGPTEEPAPEVFITYQKSDGAIKTKHYSPEVVKNDKYLSQLRSSATSAITNDYNNQVSPLSIHNNYGGGLVEAASESIQSISPPSVSGRGGLQSRRSLHPSSSSSSSVVETGDGVKVPRGLVMCPTSSGGGGGTVPINSKNTSQTSAPTT